MISCIVEHVEASDENKFVCVCNLVILSLLSCSCWHYMAVAIKDQRGLMYDGFNVMIAYLAL